MPTLLLRQFLGDHRLFAARSSAPASVLEGADASRRHADSGVRHPGRHVGQRTRSGSSSHLAQRSTSRDLNRVRESFLLDSSQVIGATAPQPDHHRTLARIVRIAAPGPADCQCRARRFLPHPRLAAVWNSSPCREHDADPEDPVDGHHGDEEWPVSAWARAPPPARRDRLPRATSCPAGPAAGAVLRPPRSCSRRSRPPPATDAASAARSNRSIR